MLAELEDIYQKGTGLSIHNSEDFVIGSQGSTSITHVDDSPALAVRITVVYGKKLLLAFPFDPNTILPSTFPYKGSTKRNGEYRPLTMNNWIRIEQYAMDRGGFSLELKAGMHSFNTILESGI